MPDSDHQDTSAGHVIAADWLIAMDARPPRAVRRGGVRVAGDGTVGAVGPFEALLRPGDAVTFFESAVLTPGLVNAHVHLDLSYWGDGGRERLAGRPLHDWVVPVVGERLLRPAEEVAAAAARGAAESLAAGVTTVVDVTPAWTAWGEVLAAVAAVPIRRVALAEVVGFGDRGRSMWRDAERALRQADDFARSGAATGGPASGWPAAGRAPEAVGLAPHAPYSTSAGLYARCLAEAIRYGRVVMTHLAETPEEVEFCLHGTGPWRRRVEQLAGPGAAPRVPGCSPVRYAGLLGLVDYSPALLAHVNHLVAGDDDFLAAGRASVVYCPRTAAFFGHADHPWRRLASAGVNVAVGTDSLASAADLSVLGELKFLRQKDLGVPAGELFAMATCNGAAAVALGGRLGSLSGGAEADVVAWPSHFSGPGGPDAAESILGALIDSAPAPRAVFVAGRASV